MGPSVQRDAGPAGQLDASLACRGTRDRIVGTLLAVPRRTRIVATDALGNTATMFKQDRIDFVALQRQPTLYARGRDPHTLLPRRWVYSVELVDLITAGAWSATLAAGAELDRIDETMPT